MTNYTNIIYGVLIGLGLICLLMMADCDCNDRVRENMENVPTQPKEITVEEACNDMFEQSANPFSQSFLCRNVHGTYGADGIKNTHKLWSYNRDRQKEIPEDVYFKLIVGGGDKINKCRAMHLPNEESVKTCDQQTVEEVNNQYDAYLRGIGIDV